MFRSFFWLICINVLIFISISILALVLTSIFGISLYGHVNEQRLIFALFFFSVIGFAGALISLLLSKFLAKKMMGVELLDEKNMTASETFIHNKIHELSIKAGLPKVPEIGVYSSDAINAFATGPSKSNSLIAVSSGLLNNMTKDEIEGVLAHEMTHISNGDMVLMTLIQGVINTFVGFFSWLLTNLILNSRNSDSNETAGSGGFLGLFLNIFFQIIFSFLGAIAAAWFSRKREYRADEGGAQLVGRSKMVAALKKLQSFYERDQQLNQTPETMAALQISNQKSSFLDLLRSHPPLQIRIETLEQNSNLI